LFYEAIGALLEHAGETLTARHSDNQVRDVRDQREFRQITLLLARVAAIWPKLFVSLERELAVLERTIDDVADQLERAGAGLARTARPAADPLLRYRRAMTDLDSIVEFLHASRAEPWAAPAITRVRACLSEAAGIQGRLVDEALAL